MTASCSVKDCNQGALISYQSEGKPYCLKHLQELKILQRDLPLAIQELHALALLAPTISDGRGHSIFQDWWPQDIREVQMRALARVRQLRRLESDLRGEDHPVDKRCSTRSAQGVQCVREVGHLGPCEIQRG
jgi:hypothetical protein